MTRATTNIAPAVTSLASVASPTFKLGSGALTNTAIVSGTKSPVPGAGTVQFELHGPGDPNCSGAPLKEYTAAYTVPEGPVTSPAFTPTQAGTYHWTAAYSGDHNNAPSSSGCFYPGAVTTVDKAMPSLSTSASAGGTVGVALTDGATVQGRVHPGASTILFQLYGPNDANCSTAIFASSQALSAADASANATSDAFRPTAPGTYRWRAFYSGDGNNDPTSGGCNEAGESATVTLPAPPPASTSSATAATTPQPHDGYDA